MKLEKIIKSIENIRKTTPKSFLLPLLLSTFTFMQLSCSSPSTPSSPSPPTNKAPETYVTKEFKDNGEIEYILSGADPDGFIDYISTKINDGDYQNFNNNTFVSVPIIKGPNTIEAISYDDEGLNDPSPAVYAFYSPTEEEAMELVGDIIEGSGGYDALQQDALLTPGESDSFWVDYLITKDDGTDAVVNYVGYTKNLEEELLNKESLDLYGIPNLYLIKIPESEISSKLNDFINNGYN